MLHCHATCKVLTITGSFMSSVADGAASDGVDLSFGLGAMAMTGTVDKTSIPGKENL